MNVDKSIVTSKLNEVFALLQRYIILISISAFALLYGYIIIQTSAAASREPDESVISQQIQAVPHPKINKETAKKIESLDDQNINVQAIFNDARENPFSE